MSAGIALLAVAASLPPICADRPAKATGTCTVPAGRLQVEAGVADWSLTRIQRTRTELITLGSTVVKLGLSNHSDLQVGFTPYTKLKLSDAASRTRASGFGDLTVRYKHRLTTGDTGTQVAVIPFLKFPTAARAIGNGKLEGGVSVPVSIPASRTLSVTFGPEVDVLADADGHGRHFAVVNLVNVAGPLAPRLTLAGELWTNVNLDPSGTVKQASVDAALAYAVSDSVQIDTGANIGLTRDTPDVELYGGLSLRF
jgi:hypothetical protein